MGLIGLSAACRFSPLDPRRAMGRGGQKVRVLETLVVLLDVGLLVFRLDAQTHPGGTGFGGCVVARVDLQATGSAVRS